jgi:tungstate transport system permease protein
MVGGNVKGYTRVLTTATVLEVSKGNFELATALSIILLLLAFAISAGLSFLQQRGSRH